MFPGQRGYLKMISHYSITLKNIKTTYEVNDVNAFMSNALIER